MTHHLFYAEPGGLDTAAPGQPVSIGGPEARHAVQVMRLEPGEWVDLADGAGRRISGPITAASTTDLTVQVDSVVDEPAPAPRLVLVQALAKGDRDLLAIQTATELGIDAVVPWQAERSIVRWKGEKAARAQAKWDASLHAAAKQARRSRIPSTRPLTVGTAVAELTGPDVLVLVLHEEAAQSLGEAVDRHLGPAGPSASAEPTSAVGAAHPAEVILVVGPEGGISPQELEALTQAGAHPVRMGQHVLRSSTAGPAATAVLQQLLGRWQS